MRARPPPPIKYKNSNDEDGRGRDADAGDEGPMAESHLSYWGKTQNYILFYLFSCWSNGHV